MLMNETVEQLSLFGPDSLCGKTSPEHFPAQRVKISVRCWRKLSELKSVGFMSLDLTPGAGNLLGESYWEMLSPWRGESSTLNTGVSPREEKESSLSQILQAEVPHKYYLTKTACLGILRRAAERGKDLPLQLEAALKVQSGLTAQDAAKNPEPIAFAANQRRDLYDIAAALGAQPGMKQQTFVTQGCRPSWDTQQTRVFTPEGLAPTLAGTDGGGGRNPTGVIFSAGFCAGAAPSAGGIGYTVEISPTLKAGESGTNMVPSILCLNDQGGSAMQCTRDVSGTLRAQEHGHQPLVLALQQGGAEIGNGVCPAITAAGMGRNNQPVLFENHGIDSRYTGPHPVAPTMSARYGTGGNNLPLVQSPAAFCIPGNTIDRQPQNGGNGVGCQGDIAYTLTATDHHAVYSRQRVDVFKDEDIASTQNARQHKDATDLVFQSKIFGQSQYGNYAEGCAPLRAQGGDSGGGSENLITDSDSRRELIRRLTPLECERLQGFPDGWTAIPGASDSARYKALGNSVAIPCVEYIMAGIALALGGAA